MAENKLEDFQYIKKIDEGTYGIVYKMKNMITGKIVAMKKIRSSEDDQGIPATALRELSILTQLKHRNIVELQGVIMEENRLYLILEYLSMDLKKYMNSLPGNKIADSELVRRFTYQITDAVLFCHCRLILHRDLKPHNLLISKDGVIKLADFGLARLSSVPVKCYTSSIVSLWYRAPEILLEKPYSCPIDVWAIGCIIAEMVTGKVLFEGKSSIDQLFKIFGVLGQPKVGAILGLDVLSDYKKTIPSQIENPLTEILAGDLDVNGIDLVKNMLIYDPGLRISARAALQHSYFNVFKDISSN